MKKTLSFIILFLMSIVVSFGQDEGNSLLWKVSGNGLEESSYLYGTFHLLCPDQLQLSEKVKKAVGKSEQLVLELDFGDPAVMQTIQQNMAYRDGTTAKDYLSEEEYQIVSNFFRDSMQLPFEQMQSIKPFFLSSMTIIHFLNCQPGSFEQVLANEAQGKNIEVVGLETVQDQLTFVESIPFDKQKRMLVENLEDYEDSKKMFDKMVELYLNEKLYGLNSLMEEYMEDDYADLQQNMLIKRNKRWVPDIKEKISQKASFIAVGAGHLPGEEGLIKLLKEEGYTVEAVY